MRKIFTPHFTLIAFLVAAALTAFCIFAYAETKNMCAQAGECEQPEGVKTEMLWDSFSRQFSSVSLR